MARPTVAEVLEALRDSYRGIDFRAVILAFGDQQGWQNAFTVIRFSEKEPQEISAEHERLKSLHELPAEVLSRRLGAEYSIEPYRGMKIELSACPVEQFEQLVARLSEGIVCTSSVAFRVFDAELCTDLMQNEMDLQIVNHEDTEGHWPLYYWGQGEQQRSFSGSADAQGNRVRLQERDLDKQSRSLGFSNFQQLVERITGAPFLRGSGQAFEILAPVYARVTSVTPSSDTIEVIIHRHPGLGQLVLECSLYDDSRWERAGGPSLGRSRLVQQSAGQEPVRPSVTFKLQNPPESGSVEATLFKQATTRVDLHRQRSALRSGVPSFRAYASFVPEEDISKYLDCLTSGAGIVDCDIYRHFTPKNGSKKTEELFEYVVMHLLGLCQLNPILLSNPQYDVIHGGLQAGSADIVASAPGGEPIVVSCTMASPDKRKCNTLLAARTAIASRSDTPPEAIKAILVTGKPSVSSSDKELLELAATDLRRLWELCRQGNLSEARRLLGIQ
jgi:hypothetical protein